MHKNYRTDFRLTRLCLGLFIDTPGLEPITECLTVKYVSELLADGETASARRLYDAMGVPL